MQTSSFFGVDDGVGTAVAAAGELRKARRALRAHTVYQFLAGGGAAPGVRPGDEGQHIVDVRAQIGHAACHERYLRVVFAGSSTLLTLTHSPLPRPNARPPTDCARGARRRRRRACPPRGRRRGGRSLPSGELTVTVRRLHTQGKDAGEALGQQQAVLYSGRCAWRGRPRAPGDRLKRLLVKQRFARPGDADDAYVYAAIPHAAHVFKRFPRGKARGR